MYWRNLREVQFAHHAFATKMLKGVVAQLVESTLKFMTDNMAIVYLRTHIGTFVFVKQQNTWRIISAQNNDASSQAAASAPVR